VHNDFDELFNGSNQLQESPRFSEGIDDTDHNTSFGNDKPKSEKFKRE